MIKDTGEQPVEVVVFDLNGTFYNRSSKEEFYKFLVSKNPSRLKYLWEMSYYYLQLKLHQIKQTEFKENFFNYLDDIPPPEVKQYAQEFWEREFPQQFNRALLERFDEFRKKGVPLFCATGGFELYVKPLFGIYKIDGFAGTQVSYTGETYKVLGKACKDEEKIRRLELFLKGKPYRIIEAYSDSKEEILDRAEKAFLIKNGKIIPYIPKD
ncbi:haloacid dehalogenase-like hydrolase [Antarcticibacterium flavum]|uniref:Haloacid dehalogenase-like hydrolase n=1 Tax=Antarcticibacterium flavum TaxID=2058175 RepID=A0A5B7X536_9FLAO|nr:MULTISPECIES: HAD family hydrolase [Antarcticibacterium]MCM4159521.1 phosphoserine phosphatase [Antarcticibacterium sp. W02-3]QCY69848.1 haloacid dehalogenase-like hydrolase [Antarcticibacterium flavum]